MDLTPWKTRSTRKPVREALSLDAEIFIRSEI